MAGRTYTRCADHGRLVRAAREAMEALHQGAGAEEVRTIERYAQPVGGYTTAACGADGLGAGAGAGPGRHHRPAGS
ncbi:MAG: hypothetical protein ACRDY3_04480 [Acidimicrobiales bacterium]